MADINTEMETEVTFLSGVTAQGRIAAQSFWTWAHNQPATFNNNSVETKWGTPAAGTGGTVMISFDTAANWTATEKAAFTAAMHLWSAEANITFSIVDAGAATIERNSDREAHGGFTFTGSGTIGSSMLGHAIGGNVTIDTSVNGFGPIGSAFSVAGGYPWQTIVHELGHLLGLGHGGAYDNGVTTGSPQFTAYDSTAYSLMSYNEAPHFSSDFAWGASGGIARSPVTPMMLDIVAIQRLYGAPIAGPLSGGQTFGFHTNIQGDIAQFFDFTVNTKPVITLFDTGLNNVFDASGFIDSGTLDLHPGTFSSVAGLKNNVGIAFGTRIDTGIGGAGADRITGNDDGDVLMGGGGGDTISGGAGNDHLYGNMATGSAGIVDGNDVINAGGGSDYVNGNAGDDTITAATGSNRLFGGQGNDVIHVTGHGSNHVNGNLGDDLLQVDGGNNEIHGGKGNDTIQATGGDNDSFGEVGNDVIWAGTGIDHMSGGAGNDLFVLGTSANAVPGSWDEIADFTDGADKFHFSGGTLSTVLHAAGGFADEVAAAAYALTAFGNATAEAAALQVDSDTYLFYTVGIGIDAIIRLDGVNAASIDLGDFTTATTHL